jgi:malonyl-CoA/methylmalonyl-CoA synthetase
VAILNSALWNGATCEMQDGKFNASHVWDALLRETDPITVFMAVPTVYNNLVKHFDEGKVSSDLDVKERLSKYRLMVSGSAALPQAQMERWQ